MQTKKQPEIDAAEKILKTGGNNSDAVILAAADDNHFAAKPEEDVPGKKNSNIAGNTRNGSDNSKSVSTDDGYGYNMAEEEGKSLLIPKEGVGVSPYAENTIVTIPDFLVGASSSPAKDIKNNNGDLTGADDDNYSATTGAVINSTAACTSYGKESGVILYTRRGPSGAEKCVTFVVERLVAQGKEAAKVILDCTGSVNASLLPGSTGFSREVHVGHNNYQGGRTQKVIFVSCNQHPLRYNPPRKRCLPRKQNVNSYYNSHSQGKV